MGSIKILGTRVDKLDMLESLCAIDSFIKDDTFHHVITLNAEIIYQAQFNDTLKEIINSADLVTPDGAGVVWASRYLNSPVKERVTGIDLMLEICRQADKTGWRIFFLGGAPEVAEEAGRMMVEEYPGINIVGTQHGYFNKEEEARVLLKIKEAEPDIIFVALGAPRQEFWIRENWEQLQVKVAMGVGGSFDVISGRVKRAPLWTQKLHLEWLVRLIKEPWRAKRMLALPKFVLLVIKSKSEMENKARQEKTRRLP